jgi:two-component system nitrogen regulation response regulator GlnG
MSEGNRILVIDDEEAICFAFRRYFERRGLEVAVAASAREGVALFRQFHPDVVFLDVRLGDADGLDVLDQLRVADPIARVVIITAYGSLETVTRAIRGKAFDVLVKPLDLDRAAELVAEARASRAATAAGARAADQAAGPAEPPASSGVALVGTSPAMQEVYKRIGKVAQSDAAVLINGQTGTGKELVARAIHQHSRRAGGAFVAVNCGALPENLVESELFGYAKGAFSGADADKPGRFEAADGGTLFLDEVAELPLAAQVKLLRFLDSQTTERLGSIRSIKLNVRVLAATNRDVRKAIEAGAFREDLFYRLAVVQIDLPPLSRRGRDIVELAEHFLAQRQAREPGRRVHLSPAAGEVLCRHDWPGNVRELRNAIEHAAIVCGGEIILPNHLPETVRDSAGRAADDDRGRAARAAEQYLDALPPLQEGQYAAAIGPVEEALIRRAMAGTDGNQSAAADLLGLHRNTLRHKLRQLGLDDEAAQ